MSAFEYLLLFAAIILGLAVSDLAISLHKLMAARGRVRWDWLAPMAAIVAFLKIVTQWWTWFAAEGIAKALTFEMYLVVLVESVLLFLLAAAALPDDVPEKGIDLRAFFNGTRRRFWLLFALQWSIWTGVSLWIQIGVQGAKFGSLSPLYLLLPATLVLAFLRYRFIQTLALAGFIALYLMQYFGRTLGQ
jgi:hypothetical protein